MSFFILQCSSQANFEVFLLFQRKEGPIFVEVELFNKKNEDLNLLPLLKKPIMHAQIQKFPRWWSIDVGIVYRIFEKELSKAKFVNKFQPLSFVYVFKPLALMECEGFQKKI